MLKVQKTKKKKKDLKVFVIVKANLFFVDFLYVYKAKLTAFVVGSRGCLSNENKLKMRKVYSLCEKGTKPRSY